MDRSREFNNAGVACLESGHAQTALALFRGALEAKLAYEKQQQQIANSSQGTDQDEACRITPETLQEAERHLQNLNQYTSHPLPVYSQEEVARQAHSPGCSDPVTIPLASRGYQPFLYAEPFELASTTNASAQRKSAIIVFNLGLVHQRLCRSAPKAAAFYEISAALFASEVDLDDTLLLRVAIMNNFGVWCFENGDGESLRTCMEHLSNLLDQCGNDLPGDVLLGVRTNIHWFLTPPNGGSPAA